MLLTGTRETTTVYLDRLPLQSKIIAVISTSHFHLSPWGKLMGFPNGKRYQLFTEVLHAKTKKS